MCWWVTFPMSQTLFTKCSTTWRPSSQFIPTRNLALLTSPNPTMSHLMNGLIHGYYAGQARRQGHAQMTQQSHAQKHRQRGWRGGGGKMHQDFQDKGKSGGIWMMHLVLHEIVQVSLWNFNREWKILFVYASCNPGKTGMAEKMTVRVILQKWRHIETGWHTTLEENQCW